MMTIAASLKQQRSSSAYITPLDMKIAKHLTVCLGDLFRIDRVSLLILRLYMRYTGERMNNEAHVAATSARERKKRQE